MFQNWGLALLLCRHTTIWQPLDALQLLPYKTQDKRTKAPPRRPLASKTEKENQEV